MEMQVDTLPVDSATEWKVSGPAEAAEICEHVAHNMESLLQLIEAESLLLRDGKPIAAAALTTRMNDYARAYLDHLRLLRAVGPDLERLAPEAVDYLRQRHDEFISVLQIDMAALVTAQAIPQRPTPRLTPPAPVAAGPIRRLAPRAAELGYRQPTMRLVSASGR